MDALCALFDAVAGIGEFLDRVEEKSQELSALVATVASVSQSVRAFACGLPPEEQNAVFNSNEVFPQLAAQMRRCDEVIARNRDRAGIEDGGGAQGQIEDLRRGERGSRLAGIRRSLGRTAAEATEALSGKLGSLGSGILKLPEDELKVIRQSSAELTRLVPQLNLALQVFALRGLKRKAEDELPARPLQEPRRMIAKDGDAAGGPGAVPLPEGPALLKLQLISDALHLAKAWAARGEALPFLTAPELRTTTTAVSTSSLESSTGKGVPPEGHLPFIFGRQELRDKIPKNFTLPANSLPGGAQQPLFRFVSRNFFRLDLPPPASAPLEEDTLELQTLCMGAPTEDLGATLAFGGGGGLGSIAPPATLASGTPLSANGLHHRSAGETRWRWVAKEEKVDLNEGDHVALLLESPPGSGNPGPTRDLVADEAVCLLGVEIQRP
mmetsp:Transcript_74185/g.191390  ORF Transcript_74185/g.191390 Transcript_74185/m.191390 type:complete len:440 (+) Transcript_74185:85-1404(+)